MRAYSNSSEEALRSRDFLKDWTGEGFLTKDQYERMEKETICDLRRTNVILRIVIFFFTLILVGAVVGLFFLSLGSETSQSGGVLLLIVAAICYGTAELAASRGFYRHGIEEGLAVCSVVLFCVGLYIILDTPRDGREFLIPALGAVASLWIWHRFGLAYAFFGAMLFIPWLSICWTSSPSGQHLMIAAFYAVGLVGIVVSRASHRFDYLNEGYSIAEALVWLGVYLAFNLQLSSSGLLRELFDVPSGTDEFSRTFYWTTWALTWIMPPVVLYRGLHQKDRPVMAMGGLVAILTLITNKSYLGWTRHTWDPMLLGALLAGVSLFLNRWLAKNSDGIRNGFTARRLSGKDKQGMSVASVALGLTASHAAIVTPGPETHFGGGGESGGAGASSDF